MLPWSSTTALPGPSIELLSPTKRSASVQPGGAALSAGWCGAEPSTVTAYTSSRCTESRVWTPLGVSCACRYSTAPASAGGSYPMVKLPSTAVVVEPSSCADDAPDA
jgi:hypothetical protein